MLHALSSYRSSLLLARKINILLQMKHCSRIWRLWVAVEVFLQGVLFAPLPPTNKNISLWYVVMLLALLVVAVWVPYDIALLEPSCVPTATAPSPPFPFPLTRAKLLSCITRFTPARNNALKFALPAHMLAFFIDTAPLLFDTSMFAVWKVSGPVLRIPAV